MSTAYDRTHVKKGALHHLGDGLPACKTADELRRRSNPHRYEYPEYDFGIIEDGTIVPMRPLTVIGAHTQADYAKYQYGDNWWNKNAMSVVLGIDSTKYAPSQAMVNSLIKFFIDKNKQHGMTMDDWYPHFQLSQTACPGAKYSKINRNTGYLDYDMVEQSVINGKIPSSETWIIKINDVQKGSFTTVESVVAEFNRLRDQAEPGTHMIIQRLPDGVITTDCTKPFPVKPVVVEPPVEVKPVVEPVVPPTQPIPVPQPVVNPEEEIQKSVGKGFIELVKQVLIYFGLLKK